MTALELVAALAKALEDGNGAALAALFTEDGVYHDIFYGTFAGRKRIADQTSSSATWRTGRQPQESDRDSYTLPDE